MVLFIRNLYLIKNDYFGTTDRCNKKKKKRISKLTLQIYVKTSPFFPSLKKIPIPPPQKTKKKEGKPSSLSRFQCLGSVGDIDEL